MEPYLGNADLIEAVRVLYKLRGQKGPLFLCSTRAAEPLQHAAWQCMSQGWR